MPFVFGAFALDLDRRELRDHGEGLPLEPKAFTVLAYLLTHRDRAVPKEELLEACWPGEWVTEAALARSVRLIRQAVRDDGDRQQVIKTLRGYGYRFVAVVEAPPIPPPTVPPLVDRSATAGPHTGTGGATVGPAPSWAPAPRQDATPALSCPQCQTANRAVRQFCAACGHALWRPCLHCGFGNHPAERFCGGCGRTVATPVPITPEARTGPPGAYTPAPLASKIFANRMGMIGERKYATVVVAGIDGLQALRPVESPEAVDDLLNQGFAQVVAEVHRVEGFITHVTPEGGTALFGVPLACEDHVLRALHAALGMQRTFATFAAALSQTQGVTLTLRLGVHTGPVVVNAIHPDLRLAYTALGATVEVATALQRHAPAGAMWVSAAVQQHARNFFQFTEMGTYTLPELAEPVGVYTCNGIGPVASRLEGALARQHTAFHGRTQELALLQACWARTCQGAGQVVCLVGEAGIGKSRLAYECQQALGAVRWLTAQALSYGQTMPYHAVIPLLRTVLGVGDTATPPQQCQRIREHLAAMDAALAGHTPLFAHMLGIPLETEALPALAPEAQRQQLLHACLQVLGQQAAEGPLCLLIEDAHWLDPSSQELLDRLVAALARRPILMLCTARPGFRHGWTDYTYFHQVAIEPLTTEETYALLRDLLRPYEASPPLQAWIHARTGGNPFFAEEIVRAMQTQGLLTVQEHVCAIAPAAHITLPSSIQGIVQARLDRLPATEKHLLQVASVIGPEVPWPWLHALMGYAEDTLQRSLRCLQEMEFLYETRLGPGPTYTFKHALVQEAVYQSLVLQMRQQYHQQIAAVLETQFPETGVTQPEVVAQHYTAADLPAQALPYWRQAGQRAIERSAYTEAIAHLRTGLAGLTTLADAPERWQQELDMQIALGNALMATKGWAAPEVEHAYIRARALCHQMATTSHLFPVLYGLCAFSFVQARLHTALERGQEFLHLAQQQPDAAPLLVAHRVLGVTLFYRAEFGAAHRHLHQCLALYDPLQHRALAFLYGQDPQVAGLAFLAWTLWVLGYPDQALARVAEALTCAQARLHPFSLAYALNWAAVIHQHRQEVQATQERAEAVMALSTAQGFTHLVAFGTVLQGWARAEQGQRTEGMTQMHRGLAAWRATGAGLHQPYFLALMAAASAQGGHLGDGLQGIREAMGCVETLGERWWEAEIYRLTGELLLAQDGHRADEAQACLRKALTIARCQQAKSLELRAARSLSRLWQQQGKRAAAYELLAPIYGWFTEGFDTADLQEAKALLEALA